MTLHRSHPLALSIAALLLARSAEAGGGTVVSVSATVLSKSNCKFTSSSASIPLGSVDAAMSADRVVSATIGYRCNGSAPVAAFSFSTDDGLHESGPGLPRMRHATVLTEFLPYSFGLSPASGTINKGVVATLTLTATVTPANVANAIAGAFSDTVTVTLVP